MSTGVFTRCDAAAEGADCLGDNNVGHFANGALDRMGFLVNVLSQEELIVLDEWEERDRDKYAVTKGDNETRSFSSMTSAPNERSTPRDSSH